METTKKEIKENTIIKSKGRYVCNEFECYDGRVFKSDDNQRQDNHIGYAENKKTFIEVVYDFINN